MVGKFGPTMVGLVLLVAGALKGYQLTTRPIAESGLLTSWVLLVGQVEVELILGLWLLSGAYAKHSRTVALVCFASFLAVCAYHAFAGNGSCGCFGSVPVSPWVTGAFDSVVLMALWWWRPAREKGATAGMTEARFAGLVGALFLLLAVGTVVAVRYKPVRLSEEGEISDDAGVIVLTPQDWVGKRFPLLNHTDAGPQLAVGRWIVVLYRRGCPLCEEEVHKYEELRQGIPQLSIAQNVAVLEVPRRGEEGERDREGVTCLRGRLFGTREWVVKLPVVLYMDDGRVFAVECPN